MDADAAFDLIQRSFEAFQGEFKEAKAAYDTTELMIASAEYELEQVKKLFAANRLAS